MLLLCVYPTPLCLCYCSAFILLLYVYATALRLFYRSAFILLSAYAAAVAMVVTILFLTCVSNQQPKIGVCAMISVAYRRGTHFQQTLSSTAASVLS